ncbi:class I SAM-dependent methyltransferase [Actinoplanes sp. NPDC051411]|uniref:class I SAM-dependent methyltransferase n=1 Tax=Actinoplanes sp. NPDC051411 TaxID=3155522 RepID=UPI00341AF299
MTSYSLLRETAEYDRLRAQARIWETATARLLDRIALPAGARCLDVGCGPGETVRLLARRVGPAGHVTGLDSDPALVEVVASDLRSENCDILLGDITRDLIPGRYDLVFARLLLFHLPQRVEVVRRLWDAVAPGGHLVIQDYDLTSACCVPAAPGVDEVAALVIESFTAAGCDVRAGLRLSTFLKEAGVGTPDGTDVSGLLVPLSQGGVMLGQVLRSLLPSAIANGVTTRDKAEAALARLTDDAAGDPDRPMLWPLMAGIWKTRP